MSKPKPPAATKPGPGTPPSTPPAGWWGRPWVLGLLLFGLAFGVFYPVVQHDYVNMDDPSYVADPHVQAGWTRASVAWAFTTWHPLTWLSHILDVQLFGPGARGPHWVNLLLHCANTVLLFALLRRLTGARWPSVFVAALFALHPQQVETVAWVSERKGVLSSFFGLSSLLAYASYAGLGRGLGSGAGCQGSGGGVHVSRFTFHGWPAYLLAFACFILGLMCKPMLVTVPCVMLLLDYWPLRRMPAANLRRLLVEKIPFFALSVLSAALTTGFQKSAGVVQTLAAHPLEKRLADALMAYPHYLGKTFWPVHLAVPYPRNSDWPLLGVLGAGVLVAALCFGVLRYGRRWPFLATGWFWFLGMLLPVSGLVQIAAQTVADRYQYLPSVGLFLVVTWGALEIARVRRVPKPLLAGLAILLLLAATARTRDQLRHWQNSETLARHAIAAVPDNWLAQYYLGLHYDEQGRKPEALEHYRLAAQLKPNYAEPWNALGCLYADAKNFGEALPCFEAAVRAKPANAEYRFNLAKALGALRRVPEAIALHEETLRRQPDFVLARHDLGLALGFLGRFEEALPHLREAVRLQPADPALRLDLGRTLANAGQPAAALEPLQEAVRLAPDNLQTRYLLGTTLVQAGRGADAIAQFQHVLARKPEQVATRLALGKAYAAQGQTNAAIAEFQAILQRQPAAAPAREALRALGVAVTE